MTIKKFVPVSIVLGCTRGRCGCYYDIGRTINEQVVIEIPKNVSIEGLAV
jgi:hypothetical protein